MEEYGSPKVGGTAGEFFLIYFILTRASTIQMQTPKVSVTLVAWYAVG